MGRHHLIVVFGPTATGKSEVALWLARRLRGRVIGADAVQVYRGLDAGSCKPSIRSRQEIPHDLIDVADPTEPFSAGRFARLALEAIETARVEHQVPIVAGGTGLYMRALLEGLAPLPSRDERLRSDLYARAAATSVEALHGELRQRDPETAHRVGPRDLQRIVRGLEVVALTGVPLSRHIADHAFVADRLPALKIGLSMERGTLYDRIDRRVEGIFQAGIVDEVRGLIADGLAPQANALKALGYREVVAHLSGKLDLDAAIDLVKRNTRRYARRQIAWFKHEEGAHWFDAGRHTAEQIARKAADLFDACE